jgi:hypothetical protein
MDSGSSFVWWKKLVTGSISLVITDNFLPIRLKEQISGSIPCSQGDQSSTCYNSLNQYKKSRTRNIILALHSNQNEVNNCFAYSYHGIQSCAFLPFYLLTIFT